MTDKESALQKSLREHNGVAAHVVLVNGEESTRVPVRPGRKGPSLTLKVAGKVTWHTARVLDKGGDVIDIVTNDAEAAAVEDLGHRATEAERTAKLVLSIVDRTMNARSTETKEAMASMVKALEVVTTMTSDLAGIYRQSIQAAKELAELQPPRQDDDEGEGSQRGQMVERLLPLILAKLAGLGPGPGPNGVKQ